MLCSTTVPLRGWFLPRRPRAGAAFCGGVDRGLRAADCRHDPPPQRPPCASSRCTRGRSDRRYRWRSVSEKLEIVQLTMKACASVGEVAQAHAVNANQVFRWRRAFERGELSESSTSGQRSQSEPIEVRIAEFAVTRHATGENPDLRSYPDAWLCHERLAKGTELLPIHAIAERNLTFVHGSSQIYIVLHYWNFGGDSVGSSTIGGHTQQLAKYIAKISLRDQQCAVVSAHQHETCPVALVEEGRFKLCGRDKPRCG